MVDASTRRAFKAMGALFTLGTAAVASIFAYQLVHRHEVRTGLLLMALTTGAAAIGLWRVRSWGRGLGLFVVLATTGLGAVALIAAIVSGRGGKLVPAILLGSSMVVGYLLGSARFARGN